MGCCSEPFSIVVIGTASSGVTTTAHALCKAVSSSSVSKKRRLPLTVASPPAASNISKSNKNIAASDNPQGNSSEPLSSAPDSYNDNAPLMITPSVSLKILCSPSSVYYRGDTPIIVCDAGPVTHPAYRDTVALSRALRTCSGCVIVLDASRSLESQQSAKVMQMVQSGIRSNIPCFILCNKYDVETMGSNFVVVGGAAGSLLFASPEQQQQQQLLRPIDVLHARYPLLMSPHTPWRCLPGVARSPLFDCSHILDFLIDPSLQLTDVVLMKDECDNNNNEHITPASANMRVIVTTTIIPHQQTMPPSSRNSSSSGGGTNRSGSVTTTPSAAVAVTTRSSPSLSSSSKSPAAAASREMVATAMTDAQNISMMTKMSYDVKQQQDELLLPAAPKNKISGGRENQKDKQEYGDEEDDLSEAKTAPFVDAADRDDDPDSENKLLY